jgi:hypothetical protein
MEVDRQTDRHSEANRETLGIISCERASNGKVTYHLLTSKRDVFHGVSYLTACIWSKIYIRFTYQI